MKLFKPANKKTQPLVNESLRDFRLLQKESDTLGSRLDAARGCLAKAKTAWAQQYWSNAIERLVFQWRLLPALHDAQAQMSVVPRWTIDYNYYELSDEVVKHGFFDRLFFKYASRDADISWSWENNRNARLARAQ